MSYTFWIVIFFTGFAGLWLIVRKNRITREHNQWLSDAEEQLRKMKEQDEIQNKFVREEYEKARKDYLAMMKEMQSEEIPSPSGLDYLPDR
jgi:hypothetical protein